MLQLCWRFNAFQWGNTATRSMQNRMQRMAHFAAILIFALAQCVSAAHAQSDHDAHTSSEDCAICGLAVIDDDIEELTNAFDLHWTRTLGGNISISSPRSIAIKRDSYSIARGPPHS